MQWVSTMVYWRCMLSIYMEDWKSIYPLLHQYGCIHQYEGQADDSQRQCISGCYGNVSSPIQGISSWVSIYIPSFIVSLNSVRSFIWVLHLGWSTNCEDWMCYLLPFLLLQGIHELVKNLIAIIQINGSDKAHYTQSLNALNKVKREQTNKTS